jgi:predicted RecA/RadA family phage recombinase
MQYYKQPGDAVVLKNTSGAQIDSGNCMQWGERHIPALKDVPDDENGAFLVEGVIELTAAVELEIGEFGYWNNGLKKVSAGGSSGRKLIGRCLTYAAAEEKVLIRLGQNQTVLT